MPRFPGHQRPGKREKIKAEYRQVLQAQHKLLGPAREDALTMRNQLADVPYG